MVTKSRQSRPFWPTGTLLHGVNKMLQRRYISGLTAKTAGITFLIAVLVIAATLLTSKTLWRIQDMVGNMTDTEIPDLMTSVRLVQQAESLTRLGHLLVSSISHAERRMAMVELNDRSAWIGQMIDTLPHDSNPALQADIAGTRQALLHNIEQLNALVRHRIDGEASGNDLSLIQELAGTNRELAGKLSVQVGYFASEIREQILSQSGQLSEEIRLHQHNLLLLTLFVLLSMLLFALYFEFKVVRRILRVQRAVSKEHPLPQEIEASGRDEITQLAGTVKSYVQRIQVQEAHMQEVHKELAFLAEHDPLTGLANRRHLYAAGCRLLEQSTQPVCVAVLDIDHFKRVNDLYGHANGDRALIHVARLIKANLRDNDILARFGGEEFAAVLAVRSLEDGRRIFESLCENVKAHPVVLDANEPFELTLSVGLTLVEPDICYEIGKHDLSQARLNEALNAADDALYNAKGSGRDRICLSGLPTRQGEAPR